MSSNDKSLDHRLTYFTYGIGGTFRRKISSFVTFIFHRNISNFSFFNLLERLYKVNTCVFVYIIVDHEYLNIASCLFDWIHFLSHCHYFKEQQQIP